MARNLAGALSRPTLCCRRITPNIRDHHGELFFGSTHAQKLFLPSARSDSVHRCDLRPENSSPSQYMSTLITRVASRMRRSPWRHLANAKMIRTVNVCFPSADTISRVPTGTGSNHGILNSSNLLFESILTEVENCVHCVRFKKLIM